MRCSQLLSRMRPQCVNARIERRIGAHHRIDRHRTSQHCGFCITLGGHQTRQRQRCRNLRAIEQRQPLLGAQHDGLHAGGLERLGAGYALALHPCLALTDQHEAHMGKRRQIARCPHRPLPRDDRQHVGIDQGRQRLHRRQRDAGGPLRQRIELHQQDEADHRATERRSHSSRMRAHDVDLQRVEVFGRDARLGQLAETGIDAIDRVPGLQQPRHCLRTAADQSARFGRQLHRDGPRQCRPDIVQINRPFPDADHDCSLPMAARKFRAIASSLT